MEVLARSGEVRHFDLCKPSGNAPKEQVLRRKANAEAPVAKHSETVPKTNSEELSLMSELAKIRIRLEGFHWISRQDC